MSMAHTSDDDLQWTRPNTRARHFEPTTTAKERSPPQGPLSCGELTGIVSHPPMAKTAQVIIVLQQIATKLPTTVEGSDFWCQMAICWIDITGLQHRLCYSLQQRVGQFSNWFMYLIITFLCQQQQPLVWLFLYFGPT